jgi:hypothetical protein
MKIRVLKDAAIDDNWKLFSDNKIYLSFEHLKKGFEIFIQDSDSYTKKIYFDSYEESLIFWKEINSLDLITYTFVNNLKG